MSNRLPTLPADDAEATIQAELDAIRTLFTFYRLTDPQNAVRLGPRGPWAPAEAPDGER